MPEVSFREQGTAAVSEAATAGGAALAAASTRESGPPAKRDTNSHGEGGYYEGYMEGY